MNLFYTQPILTSYRQELVDILASKHKLTILCAPPKNNSGFNTAKPNGATVVNCPHLPIFGGRLIIQKGVITEILKEKPDAVLACANIRDLSYWRLLFLSRRLGTRVYSHGQGLYSKRHPSLIISMLYRVAAKLSHRYICYTEFSRQTMLAAGCPPEKLAVADNAIRFSSDAASIQKTGREKGVLFVGRLREECNLEHLVDAVAHLRVQQPDAVLHVVGSGELEAEYRVHFDQPWVIFHGAVYDDAKILEISRDCRVGCYPGNAGLSVVHYFSLRLPPLVHSDMSAHMGPEPSYVQDGVNGVLFSKKQKAYGISAALKGIWEMPAAKYQMLSSAAFAEYARLVSPSMAEKIVSILQEETR